jgi:hypothetical protein
MVRALFASLALIAASAAAPVYAAPTDADVGWETMLCDDNPDANFTGYCMGPASRIEITLHAFQLRDATTQQMVTIASATRTFDFASVAANSDIGEYASALQIPYGTYDALGFVAGLNTVLAGQTDGGAAGDCAITASGFSTSLAAAAPRTIDMRALGLEYDSEAILLPPGDRLQGLDDEATGLPFTVAAGDSVSFNMSVSAGRGVWYEYSNGVCIDAGPYGPRVRTGFTLN